MDPQSLPARLRALPAFDPPADGWSRLSQRLRRRRQRYAQTGGGLALAASLLVGIGLVGLRPGQAPQPRHSVSSTAVAQMIERSQRLEHRLAQARPQVEVWDSGRANRSVALETRLRQVDAQLAYLPSGDSGATALWRDRVALLNALVELHEPQAPALQYASYQY